MSGSRIGVVVALLVVGCGDDPVEFAGDAFVLSRVNGGSVPYVVQVYEEPGFVRHTRVVGRRVELLARDSALYEWATDVVEPLEGGGEQSWGSDCESRQLAYRISGDRLILTVDPDIGLPPGSPPRAMRYDTLTLTGHGLVQHDRSPAGDPLLLEYRRGRTASFCTTS